MLLRRRTRHSQARSLLESVAAVVNRDLLSFNRRVPGMCPSVWTSSSPRRESSPHLTSSVGDAPLGTSTRTYCARQLVAIQVHCRSFIDPVALHFFCGTRREPRICEDLNVQLGLLTRLVPVFAAISLIFLRLLFRRRHHHHHHLPHSGR